MRSTVLWRSVRRPLSRPSAWGFWCCLIGAPWAKLLIVAGVALLACCPASTASNCEQLAKLTTQAAEITKTEIVKSGVFTPPNRKAISGLAPFCRVAAVLHPSSDSAIRIEVWMPLSNWNGRLEGTGNGDFADNLSYGSLADGVKRGYAAVNTDRGWLLVIPAR